MPALQPKSDDSVQELWRKIVANQSGDLAPLAGDGEKELVYKAASNQGAQIDAGGSEWTTV